MPSKNPAQRWRDIAENIEAIRDFTSGMDVRNLISSRRTIYAVTRALEIISKASRRLPHDFKATYSSLAGWPSPLLAVLLVLCTATGASSADLPEDTLAAWGQYIGAIDARLKTTSADRASLQLDQSPVQLRKAQRGEVSVSQIKTLATQRIPHGLIHDWIGTVFIPNATVADVLTVVRNYDQYPKWYGPTIAQANVLARSVDQDRYTIRYVRTVLWVTVVMEAEYEWHYSPLDETSGYSATRSVRINEIQDYGKPSQRKTPADDGSGYLWRTYTVSRYQQPDNGVYLEQENIALGRSIPAAFRWVVEPAVRHLAKDLLEKSLQQTRDAVRSRNRN